MPKRAHRSSLPEAAIQHADLADSAVSSEATKIVSVRITAWHGRLWEQLRTELGLSVADLGRRALLVAAAVLFRESNGRDRPDVYLLRPNGEKVQLVSYLGLGESERDISVQQLRGTARPSLDHGYGITLRVYGFWVRVWDQLLAELECSPSELVRHALVLLAATVLKDADGSRPAVYIHPAGAARPEPLNAFLGIEALTDPPAHSQDGTH